MPETRNIGDIPSQKMVIDIVNNTAQGGWANKGEFGTRELEIYIVKDGAIFDISSYLVTMYCITPYEDKLFVTVNKTNAAMGKASIVIPQQIAEQAGVTKCCISLSKKGQHLLSVDFKIKINKSIYKEESITVGDDFSALQDALAGVANLEGNYVPRLTALESGKASKDSVTAVNTRVDGVSASLEDIVCNITSNNIDDTEKIQYVVTNFKNITFPPNRTFKIKNTVKIPSGTHIDFNNCTFIPVAGGTFINNFMFLINSIDGVDWVDRFGGFTNSIKNLTISNKDNILNVKGVFLGAVSYVYNLRTEWLHQSIRIVDRFLDMLRLDRIFVVHHTGNLYAISQDNIINGTVSKNANGDAWIFSQLQFEGTGDRNAIYLCGNNDTCTIDGVVNGRIVLKNGSFNLKNLHIEIGNLKTYGAKILLENSMFYFRGSVNGTPVQLFCNENGSKEIVIKNTFFTYQFWDDNNLIDKGSTYYSIDIDPNFYSNIELDNVNQGVLNTNTSTGIKIRRTDKSSMSFWDYVACCRKTVVNANSIIEPTTVIKKNPNGVTDMVTIEYKQFLMNYSSNEDNMQGILWKGVTGTYYYKVGVISDIDRMIGLYNSSELSVSVNKLDRKSVNIKINPTIMGKMVNSYLIVYRGLSTGVYTDRAIIPVSNIGSNFIDDFNSIGLINWVSVTGPVFILNPHSQLEYNCYNNNVTAYGTTKPTTGTWTVGDRIIIDNPQVGQVGSYRYIDIAGTGRTWKTETTISN